MDGEGSSVNLNSLQLTGIYKTICKIYFLEEKKHKKTLTKSSRKDCISEMNEDGLCLKIQSVYERMLNCKLISLAQIGTTFLVLVCGNKKT